MQLSPRLVETGWLLVTRTQTVGALFRSNGFPKRLLVTFDSLSQFNHGRLAVSGDKIALHCEADHLHVGTTETTWFQTPEITDVVQAAKEVCSRYDEVILYGHSMGGYAALLLSGLLGATNVVAFVPQFSINPDIVPFDTRFKGFADKTEFVFDDMNATISQTAPKYVVFDPHFNQDRGHYDMMAHHLRMVPVRFPFAGHYPGQVLHEAGLLREVVADLLLQRTDAGHRRRKLRDARRRSHRYFVERAIHVARRGHLKHAFELVNIAYVLSPDNVSVLETFHALLQFDSAYYGLSHAMLRLVLKEKPEWTYYEGNKDMLWRELKKHAAPITRIDTSASSQSLSAEERLASRVTKVEQEN